MYAPATEILAVREEGLVHGDAAVRVCLELGHPGPDPFWVELLVPCPVQRVSEVDASAVSADLDHLWTASLIVTSNKPFSAWGQTFGDEVTAAAMIDRLVHHAEILARKGGSYRLKDRDLARATPTE
jgi:hypothetical protein